MQGRLFPLPILNLVPPIQSTADCRQIGVGENGLYYAIKRTDDGFLIPLAEWFFNQLAHDIGIPTPQFEIVALPDDTLAFGSRWEGGTRNAQTPESDLLTQGKIKPEILTAIYAYDLFIGNIDRRLGNYLLRYNNINPQLPDLIAFDYSRVAMTFGIFPSGRLPAGTNTERTFSVLRKIHGYHQNNAEEIINKINSLPSDYPCLALKGIPKEWANPQILHTLYRWWECTRHIHCKRLMHLLSNA